MFAVFKSFYAQLVVDAGGVAGALRLRGAGVRRLLGLLDGGGGIGLLFGLQLSFNIELPSLATSLQDFWRRWPVTLSKWFRDDLYIPLGGNRANEARNRVVTMKLAGLWHGAPWTFVLWGFLQTCGWPSSRLSSAAGPR